MSVVVGWLLAAAAVALGHLLWGWPGVALAVTLIVFWLLLQFSRALRVLRHAGRAPVGRVDSAVMLNARLQRGQRLPQILALTRSLGVQRGRGDADREVFEWRDGGGAAVRIELEGGKLARWQLLRTADTAAAPTTSPSSTTTGGEP
ncbi:MAG TPA: hypothetical protein VLE94_17470 [Burkholderiaceae bacterium]|nr:hypothetical protein [Burkholderiaceae bacterium]